MSSISKREASHLAAGFCVASSLRPRLLQNHGDDQVDVGQPTHVSISFPPMVFGTVELFVESPSARTLALLVAGLHRYSARRPSCPCVSDFLSQSGSGLKFECSRLPYRESRRLRLCDSGRGCWRGSTPSRLKISSDFLRSRSVSISRWVLLISNSSVLRIMRVETGSSPAMNLH